ncbi:MAG: hypothetical protein KC466_00405, partial [Myxococcales bacterium]|nr:hypothetical protein [Myxococcales bacterium]
GALMMDERCGVENYRKNPAYLNALIHYLFDSDVGRGVSVMMPYATGLRFFADWYVQLWAESLGKAVNFKGEEVNTGPLPIAAVGATDQHSQMQLFMEGPHDKVVTFLRVEDFGEDVALPKTEDDTNAYLGGSSLATLLNAEQRATSAALAEQGRPNITISLPDLSAKSLGQLFMLYEIQTVAAGALYGINPLDQPGVELGKRLTFALMGKEGYDAERAVVDERAKPVAKLLLR